jgi:hypothetical protein
MKKFNLKFKKTFAMAASFNVFSVLADKDESWADAAEKEVKFKSDDSSSVSLSSNEDWEEVTKESRRGGGNGSDESSDCSGPFGMSIKKFFNLYTLFTEAALSRLDEDGNTYRYFLGPLKSGATVFVVDGQEKDSKTGKFKTGTSWTDKFFIKNPVLGVTQELSGYRHYKREHSLASLIINGRDLTISPEAHLGNLESYLPGEKSLKELVMSRFEEIISSTPSLRGKRKVEFNQKLDHRIIAVTVTMCVTTDNRVPLPSLVESKTPEKKVPNLIEEIWATARKSVAPTPCPTGTHSPQTLVTAPIDVVTPTTTSPALSDEQFKRLIEILGAEKAITAFLALRG